MKSIFTVFLFFLFSFLAMNNANAQADPPVSAKLNHIAVYVSDLAKSTAFYKSLLNLPIIEEPFKDGKHVWFSLGSSGQLHLIQGEFENQKFNKNEHLCFSVSSIGEFINKLDKQKIEYSNWPGTAKEPTLRVDGVKQIYFQDPDGHWLEINDAP
ncbi:VOC family protein [Pedobacter sp.]|uniref:VOC family protein n=1 Tax=Pedobacter sp. TaxID=1411316 RepID=UPI003D7FCEF9